MMRFILFFCFALCLPAKFFAFVFALEREVNLTLTNEKVSSALNKIQEQTGLVFSYQPSVLSNLGTVSLQLRHKTVREALALIFPKNITYKSKSNYIILKEKPVEKETKKAELSGYVYDKNTDKKLPNVTIYDKNTLQSVTTNEYGYYSISMPDNNQCLSVNKENYRDTCVSFTYLKDKLTNISIDPVSDSVRARDSLFWKQRLHDFSESTNLFFKRFKGYVNTINVKDTLTRNFQVSLLPFVGTNGLLSGNVYNKFSLNIFGGYSRGTRALELGGFFNIDREKVTGAQLAGFFNVVGDSVRGAQLAGFFNVTGKQVDGIQATGFVNMNLGKMNGVQYSGFLNLNFGDVKGMQGAGLMNINGKSMTGISMAGGLNINRYSVTGLQLAGLMNITGDTLTGLSVAGGMNLAWYSNRSLTIAGIMNNTRFGHNNMQIAGFINSTGKGSTDLQVAGFFNRAHHLRGLQLGFLNYADSATGVPIGFLSFVKSGKHQLEFSTDELFYANLSFRTGVNVFHNILTAGIQPSAGGPVWGFGYGVGSTFKLKNKLSADLSATMQHLSSGKLYFATSELYRFYAGVEYKFGKQLSIAAGPTFNLYWSDALLPDYENTYSQVAPYHSFSSSLPNDFNLKGWFGARVAVRFF
jgi:carboxypeptidase-like protein